MNPLMKIAKEYREGALGSKPSNKLCFIMCYVLSGYFRFIGYACELVQGGIGEWEHFWIQFPDGSILDPTADQFKCPDGGAMPEIYYGRLPEWYHQESCDITTSKEG